eukprot:gene3894-13964_t
MATAGVDVVGFLPAPPSKANRGCADLLEGQLFAYGVGSGVTVVDVPPVPHPKPDLPRPPVLPQATDDGPGEWLHVKEYVKEKERQRQTTLAAVAGAVSTPAVQDGVAAGAILGFEWVVQPASMLAVLVAPATLILWDTRADKVVWKRDLSSSELFNSMVLDPLDCRCLCLCSVKRDLSSTELFNSMVLDPLDCRRLCLCGSQGALVVVQLNNPAQDQVDVKQFRVNLSPAPGTAESSKDRNRSVDSSGGAPPTPTFQAVFTVTRDLLFVLLSREMLIFDLELGVPAATRNLPASRPAFNCLLGVFGRGTSHGGGEEGGSDFVYCSHVDGALSIWVRVPGMFGLGTSHGGGEEGGSDFVYCSHVDGALSIWVRVPGELWYNPSCTARLLPPSPRGTTNPISLMAVRSQIWKQDVAADDLRARPSLANLESVTKRLQTTLLPDRMATDSEGSSTRGNRESAESVTKRLQTTQLPDRMATDSEGSSTLGNRESAESVTKRLQNNSSLASTNGHDSEGSSTAGNT